MEKEKEIKELQQYVGMACEMYDSKACSYEGDCTICSIAGDIAHKIYNAGYRKVENVEQQSFRNGVKEILQILYNEAMEYNKPIDGIIYMAKKYEVELEK